MTAVTHWQEKNARHRMRNSSQEAADRAAVEICAERHARRVWEMMVSLSGGHDLGTASAMLEAAEILVAAFEKKYPEAE